MDITDAQAIAGILISLTVFSLVLRYAVSTQRRSAAMGASGVSPKPSFAGKSAFHSLGKLAIKRFTAPTQFVPDVERVNGASNPDSVITFLTVTQDRGFRDRLKGLAEFYGWDLVLCANFQIARVILASQVVPIVLYDRDTLATDWHDAFEMLLRADRLKCLVLCSETDDDCLWQDVVRRGGYDVVHKPIREEKVVRTIQFAWIFWKTVRSSFSANSPFPGR